MLFSACSDMFMTEYPSESTDAEASASATVNNSATSGTTANVTDTATNGATQGATENTTESVTGTTSTVTTQPTDTPTATVTVTPTHGSTVTNTPTIEVTPAPTPTPSTSTNPGTVEIVQKPAVRDYTTMWWRDGFNRGGKWQMNIQTGYYGLTVNTITGRLNNLGAIRQELSQSDASKADNTLLESLPGLQTDYFVINSNGNHCAYSGTTSIGNGLISSRILETGRYMQRIDIMKLRFNGISDVIGRVEIAAMPEYMALELGLFSPDSDKANMGMGIIFTLPSGYNKVTQSNNGRAVTITNASGNGYTFVKPDDNKISYDVTNGQIAFFYQGVTLKKAKLGSMGIVIIPSTRASKADADKYLAAESVTASASQIFPGNGRKQKVSFDDHKGYLSIDMNRMMTASLNDFQDESLLDDMDRLKFSITNNSNINVKIPIQFEKSGDFAVEGFCPMIREIDTGEPVGVQVQLSKNWHIPHTDPSSTFYLPLNDIKRLWSGEWFHGYTVLEIPAGKTVTYEMTIAYATWGGVYTCSHSQISLAGWGGNFQQWETSAIGAFGESFCYDPETAHGRAFIDDIRPLAVNSMGGKYGWTACNGGGNMLLYTKSANGSPTYFKKVQTNFKKQGPNLTEVTYTGITIDDAVKFEITAYLPRTNDVSRVWHKFSYTFLKDVSFNRMVFYQFGADGYNDNRWDKMAVGNDAGTVNFKMGNNTYYGEFACPTTNSVTYIGTGSNMQRIDVEGTGLWFAFTNAVPQAHKDGPFANRMLNVHSYNAVLNGKTYTKPSFNIRNTVDAGIPCLLVELCPSAEVGNTIRAGSTVNGTVEYLNIPIHKSDYFGSSTVLNGIPANEFNTYKVAYRYAVGNKTTTTASVGTVEQQTPIFVKCASGEVLAEITVKGGMSYVPLTFRGVPAYTGYELQVKKGSKWEKVDQSVHGNDYWQCWYDSDKGTYELTYNVEHTGDKNATYSYRLVKSK